jgi:hypothetical protein
VVAIYGADIIIPHHAFLPSLNCEFLEHVSCRSSVSRRLLNQNTCPRASIHFLLLTVTAGVMGRYILRILHLCREVMVFQSVIIVTYYLN